MKSPVVGLADGLPVVVDGAADGLGVAPRLLSLRSPPEGGEVVLGALWPPVPGLPVPPEVPVSPLPPDAGPPDDPAGLRGGDRRRQPERGGEDQ